jgi:hypothetical protein
MLVEKWRLSDVSRVMLSIENLCSHFVDNFGHRPRLLGRSLKNRCPLGLPVILIVEYQ